MQLLDFFRHFADTLDVAVLVTDAELSRPGPTILYANSAFLQMSGFAAGDVVGQTPRMMQGPGTNQEGKRLLLRTLKREGRFLGRLQNYRRTGEAYLCEIDIRPIHRLDGNTEAFIAFEREVVRRRGKPTDGGAGRYRPVDGQEVGGIPFMDLPIFGGMTSPATNPAPCTGTGRTDATEPAPTEVATGVDSYRHSIHRA